MKEKIPERNREKEQMKEGRIKLGNRRMEKFKFTEAISTNKNDRKKERLFKKKTFFTLKMPLWVLLDFAFFHTFQTNVTKQLLKRS